MTKAARVARMAQEAEVTRRQAEQALEAFVDSIQGALRHGESLSLVGFGRFSVLARAGRKGQNSCTGQDLMIPARKSVKFSVGKGLRERLQSPAEG